MAKRLAAMLETSPSESTASLEQPCDREAGVMLSAFALCFIDADIVERRLATLNCLPGLNTQSCPVLGPQLMGGNQR